MPEPRSKIIDGETFQLSNPYQAGHQLTEIEANVLNQVRSENIGNNLRAAVKDAKEKRDKGDPTDFDGLKALVADYDEKYSFALGGGGAPRKDPVEREAYTLAVEFVKGDLAKKGRTWKQVPEGLTEEEWVAKRDAVVDQVASRENIIELARQRVEQKKALNAGGSAALDDLLKA